MYTVVYMSQEVNEQMFRGETVKGSLVPCEGHMKITVGNYRVTHLEYPFVLVKPAS